MGFLIGIAGGTGAGKSTMVQALVEDLGEVRIRVGLLPRRPGHLSPEERGRQVESALAQYLTTVRPMHERYVEPTKAHADLVVVNDGMLSDCVGQVEAAVRGCLGRMARR